MRRFAIAIVTATLLIGLAGGVARAATSSSPSPGGEKLVFRVGTMQDIDSLNPFAGVTVAAYEMFHLNYDMLTGYAPNGDVRPEIADSWEASDDGLTWTFKIHPGITWHGGEPLTASDVAFTFNYIIDDGLLGPTRAARSEHQGGRGHRRRHGGVPPYEAEGHHAAPVDPHRPGAHLEQDPGRHGSHPTTPSRRSSAPAPSRRSRLRRARTSASPPTRTTGRAPQGRRGDPPDLHQPGHHGDGPQGRHPRRRGAVAGGAVQRPEGRTRHHGESRPLPLLRRAGHTSTTTTTRRRTPFCATSSSARRSAGRSTSRRLSTPPSAAMERSASRSSGRSPTTPGRRRPRRRSATTWRRPPSCSTRPATPTRTGTASGRTSRASRSSCGSGRGVSPPSSSAPAS